jgi:hypothetical protein
MSSGKNKTPGRRPPDVMLRLDPSDPRSLEHPCHQKAWLELARAIGRTMAHQEWDRAHKGESPR